MGWSDAGLFLSAIPQSSSVPELGFRDRWSKRRGIEHTQGAEDPRLWEYQHGHAQGYDAAIAWAMS